MAKYNKNKGSKKDKYSKDSKYSKDRDTESEEKETLNSKDKSGKPKGKGYKNDASWYIPDETLRNQAVNYPFKTFLGLPDTFRVNNTDIALGIPTVMSIRVNPSLGKTALPLSQGVVNLTQAAVNATARVWYNKISAQTGRTANYSPDDIAIILGAMSELVSTISMAFRAYGLAFNYSMRNRAIPKSLIGATGMQPDTILNDMAGFRMRLNTLLIQANALPIPAGVKLFEKNWNLYSKVFVDETSPMAQMFLFTAYSTWKLQERGGQTGSILETLLLNNTAPDGTDQTKYTYTADELLDTIEAQILALQLATTYNQVYSDMMQVMEKTGGKFYQFGYLPELFVVSPEFSEEAISQMHNLVVMGQPLHTVPQGAPSYVTPDNNVVADVTKAIVNFNPSFQHYMGMSFEPLLDMPFTGNPTTDDKVNSTRFMCARSKVTSGTSPVEIYDDYTISDKYVVAVLILTDSIHDLANAVFDWNTPAIFNNSYTHNVAHIVTAFRHAPTIYLMDNTTRVFDDWIQECNYFTHISFDVLNRMNDLCMYGLLESQF